MKALIADLQANLRQVAVQEYETVTIPGFTLCFHPSDDLLFFNYAIPDEDWADAGPPSILADTLSRLRAEFAARSRRARFEFIQDLTPRLASAQRAAGIVEQACQPLMLVQPARFRAAPSVPGLTIDELDRGAPTSEVQTFLSVQRRGFSFESTDSATEDEARIYVSGLGQGRMYIARLGGTSSGMPVGVGMYSAPLAASSVSHITVMPSLVTFCR